MKNFECRFCRCKINYVFVDLGTSPLSNAFLTDKTLEEPEKKFPLKVFVCENCFLVQLPEFESPGNIFNDYAYFSSYSKSWLEHVENYVNMITEKNSLGKDNLVIELASNDGYLLQFFKKKEIPVKGIEPAANVAKIAQEKGIETIVEFFGEKLAKKLSSEGTKADLIIGNNVLAHVPNINNFVKGISILLKTNGVVNIEFPHLLQIIQHNQFDTIYHEHFSYLSLSTVKKIFEFHNLIIFDVEEIPTHGGSLRIYAKHMTNKNFKIQHSVNNLLEKEKDFGLMNLSFYLEFTKKVELIKKKLIEFFNNTKQNGKKIVCYGAAAKGNTLLNFCKINKDSIEYVVDNNPHKQGLYLPGSHIPIKNPEEIIKTKPD